ncbi:MAG: hypothetical protein ACLP9L_08295 [Thermoguttaceae bacterium]
MNAKADDVVNNDEEPTGAESGNPHGMMNPHGGIQMPEGISDTKLENNGKLDIETVHFSVPKSWIPKSHSQMLKAEFAIPKAEGDKEDGRLTVTHLGGSLEENVKRWKGQFGDKLDKENEETIDAGGVKITLVDLTGTFEDSRAPMMASGPAVSRPDYRMLGAIFQVPGDDLLYFIKCYGPKKTITARADEVKEYLRSLKVDK